MTVKGKISGARVYLVRPEEDAEAFLKHLGSDKRVEQAEMNRTIQLNSAESPLQGSPELSQEMAAMLDDRNFVSFNGAIVPAAYINQPAVARIALNEVRSVKTGAGTRVAYIDTGVDPSHPALAPWLDPGADLLSGGSSSEFEGLSQEMAAMLDYEMAALLDKRFMMLLGMTSTQLNSLSTTELPAAFGHGTLVAGLIHLVAPDARLVPLRAFDAHGYTTLFTLVAAVYKAIELNVDVLNLSFSMEQEAPILREALRAAHGAKIVVVASAGNENRTTDEIYPASYPEVFGVAATDLNDQRADFSNYGKGVAISAPGAFVISTLPGGNYAAVWGTSFSAPIVSGAMSLIVSSHGFGQLDSQKIMNSADSIDLLNPGFEKMLGKGRLNVTKAVTKH
jgi:subtilisin family serine protease